jgi:hypothetical protein
MLMVVQEEVDIAQTRIIIVKTVLKSQLRKKLEEVMWKGKILQLIYSDKTNPKLLNKMIYCPKITLNFITVMSIQVKLIHPGIRDSMLVDNCLAQLIILHLILNKNLENILKKLIIINQILKMFKSFSKTLISSIQMKLMPNKLCNNSKIKTRRKISAQEILRI